MNYRDLTLTELRTLLLSKNHSPKDYETITSLWEEKILSQFKDLPQTAINHMKRFIQENSYDLQKVLRDAKITPTMCEAIIATPTFKIEHTGFYDNNVVQVLVDLESIKPNLSYGLMINEKGEILEHDFIW